VDPGGEVGVVSTLLGPEGTRVVRVASNHRVCSEFKPVIPGGVARWLSSERVSWLFFENYTVDASIFVASYEEHTVDVLAPGADEGRRRLRKASGSCQPSCDPRVSEWGNPASVMWGHPRLNI
jgi:hypothetical protein